VTRSVLIVGTGLLGTSVGLALRRAGWRVHLQDTDAEALRLAVGLGAGRAEPPDLDPELVLLAVPPSQVAMVGHRVSRHYLNAIFSDVASTKSELMADVETLGLDDRFVGGHPMAGGERSGPGGARSDLFEGRPWVLCAGERTEPRSVALVAELVRACGALPVAMSAADHDRAVALVSHMPQLVASATAAQLFGAEVDALDLSGQGLRDTVRIAGSDPGLWVDIVSGNAGPVAEVLEQVAQDLAATAVSLRNLEKVDISAKQQVDESAERRQLLELLARGQQGYARIPGKHGAPPVGYAVLPIVIPDEPGALARLFLAAGDAAVNIEDVRIEHSPGQPVGLVEILVLPEAADRLAQALTSLGWSVH
jgi:prephenate dehydrogenase